MATLIDPPANFNNNDTGVPPGPPEAHQRANFQQRKFAVAMVLYDLLQNANHGDEQAAIQFFVDTFVPNNQEGAGFWSWGDHLPHAQCDLCFQYRECIEAIWNYRENGDE